MRTLLEIRNRREQQSGGTLPAKINVLKVRILNSESQHSSGNPYKATRFPAPDCSYPAPHFAGLADFLQLAHAAQRSRKTLAFGLAAGSTLGTL